LGVSLNFGGFFGFFWGGEGGGGSFFCPCLFLWGLFGVEERKPEKLGACGICPKSGGFAGFRVVFVLVCFEEALLSDDVVVYSLPTKSVPSQQQLLLFDKALLALLLLLLGFFTISFCKTFHKKKKKKKRFKFITLGNLLFFP
jgi:hypothetical protein